MPIFFTFISERRTRSCSLIWLAGRRLKKTTSTGSATMMTNDDYFAVLRLRIKWKTILSLSSKLTANRFKSRESQQNRTKTTKNWLDGGFTRTTITTTVTLPQHNPHWFDWFLRLNMLVFRCSIAKILWDINVCVYNMYHNMQGPDAYGAHIFLANFFMPL